MYVLFGVSRRFRKTAKAEPKAIIRHLLERFAKRLHPPTFSSSWKSQMGGSVVFCVDEWEDAEAVISAHTQRSFWLTDYWSLLLAPSRTPSKSSKTSPSSHASINPTGLRQAGGVHT